MWDLKKDKPARKGGQTCGRAGPGLGEGHGALPGRGAPAAGAAVQPAGHSQRCRVASAGHAEGARTWDGHGAGGEGSADPRGRPSRFHLPEASGAGVTPAGRPFTAPRTRSSASPWAGAAVTAPWRLGRGGVTPAGTPTRPAGSSAGKPRPAHTVASSPAVPGSRLIRTGQRRLVPPGFSISFDCSVQMGSSVPSTTGAGSPEGEGAGRHPRGPQAGGPPRARMCLWAPLMPDARGRA